MASQANSQDNSWPTEPQALVAALDQPDTEQLKQWLHTEFYKISLQHSFYIGLMACSLCVFSVVLFLNARYYHNLTLWGIGICLLIFGLIQFLELDFVHNKQGSLLQKIWQYQKSFRE